MLEQEREYYERNLASWLNSNPGQYVIIKGNDLGGFYNTIEDALREGARRYGMTSFLVRAIERTSNEVSIPALALGILRADSTHAS